MSPDDDHGRSESQSSQEHLHLLSGRVLGLVQDDEGVVQGSSAHVGQGAISMVPDVMRRGIDSGSIMSCSASYKGAQVGIDLFAQSSGKEAQALPRFDGGAGQHDAVHLLVLQRLHRLGTAK